MARKKRVSHENHERWLVSYADFITLLFAFFVVMFASTRTDKTHAKAVSEAINKALSNGAIAPRLASILGGSREDLGKGNALGKRNVVQQAPSGVEAQTRPADAESAVGVPLTTPLKLLSESLKEEIAAGNVHLKLEPRGLVIGLQTAAFFPSGGDGVTPAVDSTMAKLAEVLNKVPNALRLEGHTDSVPISTARFQSNWELSAARSIAMMRLLSEEFGVSSRRMAIVGYAENGAVDSNDTEGGRERNRRVDIVIVSDLGMRAEPTEASGTRGSGRAQVVGSGTAQSPEENKQGKMEGKKL